ncbi:MAG: hypothetical protein OSA84_01720 [Akkermansiaceae bacterium]|nr:hypothetical protein [Akkermansiaceae bacterium]
MNSKLITLIIATAGILPSQAVSTINWEFGVISVLGDGALADGKAVYLIANTADAIVDFSALETSLVGIDLDSGITFATDLLVLGVGTPDFVSFGVAGTGNAVASDIAYTNGLSDGDALGILWIDQADGVIGNNVKFGWYESPTLTMPADGSNVAISFLSTSAGGSILDSSLTTTNITIPEPSIALLGALGVFSMFRRRR